MGLKKAEAISIPCAGGLYVGRPDDPTLGMTSKNAWKPGEDPPGPDMYQLYRAADRTSPPAPVIAQAGCTQGLKLIVRPSGVPESGFGSTG